MVRIDYPRMTAYVKAAAIHTVLCSPANLKLLKKATMTASESSSIRWQLSKTSPSLWRRARSCPSSVGSVTKARHALTARSVLIGILEKTWRKAERRP